MQNDPQVLADLIRIYDKTKLTIDIRTQKGMCAIAGLRATMDLLKERMTPEEISEACDIMAGVTKS